MTGSTPPPLPPAGAEWASSPLSAADAPALAEIRAQAMRPSLERLGRYDEHRVRERFTTGFDAAHTWGIVVDDELVGCVALRPDGEEFWLEHLMLLPRLQGRGIGSQVMAAVLNRAGRATVRLDVLQGSEARGLYERWGFVVDREDPIDVFMVRRPG